MENAMKALTLWQPWATLMMIPVKHIETRGWYCMHRGPLAIHAAARIPPKVAHRLAGITNGAASLEPHEERSDEFEVIARALREAGYQRLSDLPLGAVLGMVEVHGCRKTEYLEEKVSFEEWCYGDYTPGRFGILTRNSRRFAKPIPAKGKLGLWDWEPPKGVEV
jgi:activating signal cointegrator 1